MAARPDRRSDDRGAHGGVGRRAGGSGRARERGRLVVVVRLGGRLTPALLRLARRVPADQRLGLPTDGSSQSQAPSRGHASRTEARLAGDHGHDDCRDVLPAACDPAVRPVRVPALAAPPVRQARAARLLAFDPPRRERDQLGCPDRSRSDRDREQRRARRRLERRCSQHGHPRGCSRVRVCARANRGSGDDRRRGVRESRLCARSRRRRRAGLGHRAVHADSAGRGLGWQSGALPQEARRPPTRGADPARRGSRRAGSCRDSPGRRVARRPRQGRDPAAGRPDAGAAPGGGGGRPERRHVSAVGLAWAGCHRGRDLRPLRDHRGRCRGLSAQVAGGHRAPRSSATPAAGRHPLQTSSLSRPAR